MSSSPPVELVIASFDDPIVTGLRIEQGARSGLVRPDEAPGSAGGPPPDAGVQGWVLQDHSQKRQIIL
jgi:hypothetical protein